MPKLGTFYNLVLAFLVFLTLVSVHAGVGIAHAADNETELENELDDLDDAFAQSKENISVAFDKQRADYHDNMTNPENPNFLFHLPVFRSEGPFLEYAHELRQPRVHNS